MRVPERYLWMSGVEKMFRDMAGISFREAPGRFLGGFMRRSEDVRGFQFKET